MVAEIICVGTELLLGQILNTNSQYLAQKLAELGIDLYFQTTVGDNMERLKMAIDIATKRADILIFTGGLGPTSDDITKEAVADYFGLKLVLDEDVLRRIEKFFERRQVMMPQINKNRHMFLKTPKFFITKMVQHLDLSLKKTARLQFYFLDLLLRCSRCLKKKSYLI